MRTLLRAAAALAFAYVSLVGPASAATTPNVVAQAPAATGMLNGRVTDQSGNPISGAVVTIIGQANASATTGNDGRFTFTLAPGVYTVTVNRGGFSTAQNDVAIVAGSSIALSIPLQEQNLQSLRVIGRVSTNSGRAQLNVSESSVSTLPPLEIALRQNNTLTDTVATLPGVVVQRTFSSTPNTNFVVRGAGAQTRVTIDGHPISSGIFGQWNTNYASSGIFNDVEVVKGAGLNGSIAGESAVGTVNLRTRDFTAKNSYGVQLGTDSYNGGIYNAFLDMNFLKNNKLSLILAKSFTGFNGPWNNAFIDRAGGTTLSAQPIGLNQPQSFVGLDQWRGDFSNRYGLEAELVKLRYRFSETSSVTLQYLGMQGQYQPQGGSYGTYLGQMTLQACQSGVNSGAFQPTLATCGAGSTYTAPYTFNNVGATVPTYSWFPNSYIQNNEPQFSAEFRTTFKNDTILFRPYTHIINRYISGVRENSYPGNGGGWFAVTNNANCQVKFIQPGTAGGPVTGASGPCFPVTTGPNGPSYIGNDPTGHQFATTPTAPVCSPAPPFTCFTTTTGIQNDGTFGYGTPFSQPEVDRLNGYTLSVIHPLGPHMLNASVDYRKDFAQSQSSDQSGAAAGCQFVIGSVSGANVFYKDPVTGVSTPFQPGCSTAQFPAVGSPYTRYNLLPRSAIGTPPTVSQYTDFALTGSFRFGDKLSVAIGNYLELYKLNAQIEDPAVFEKYRALGNFGAAPVALLTRTQNYTHYDPHVGVEYRVNRDLSLRANGGSSITQPWPGIVSGFGSVTIPNAANGGNYTINVPNFNLKPETTVSYDLGFDQRLRDGGILSLDLYDITIHDVFLANTTNIGTIPLTCGPGNGGGGLNATALCLQTVQINGPIQRTYGAELAVTKNPINGWGYYLSATLARTYLDQLPLSIYAGNTVAGNGNFNVNGAQLFGNPFFKSYGQLLYAHPSGFLFSLGADYEGPDNSTFGPAFVLWDSAVRIPVAKRLKLQISAQNLFNLNTGTLLGRSLSNQGNIQPQVYLPVGTTTLLQTGAASNINALPPRTIRMSLNFTP